MRKLFAGFALALIATIVVVMPVLGTVYSAKITVTNSQLTTDYANIPVVLTMSNTNLISSHYITANGLNVNITSDGVKIPAMLCGDKTLFVLPSLDRNSSANPYYNIISVPNTYMPIILGLQGYTSVADNAAIEPANVFKIDASGYFDLSATADAAYRHIFKKLSALDLWNPSAGVIQVDVSGSSAYDQQQTTSGGGQTVYGNYQFGQVFTTGMSGYLQSFDVYITAGAGTPSTTWTVDIYAVSGGLPTGASLATCARADSGLSVNNYNTFTFSSPPLLAYNTQYVAVAKDPSANVANYFNWAISGSNTYAGGTPVRSTDGGTSFTAMTADHRFRTTMVASASLSASGQTNGAHDYIVSLNGGTMFLMDGENYLPYGSFEAGNPPTGWTQGAGATISQITGGVFGTKALRLVANVVSNAYALEAISAVPFRGKTIAFGVWAKTTAANVILGNLQTDGTGAINVQTSYCPSDGQWHWLSGTGTVPNDANSINFYCAAFAGSVTADFDDARIAFGSSIATPTTAATYLNSVAFGGSIVDNAEAILVAMNPLCTYLDYFKYYAGYSGGWTQKIWYQPNTIVNGTTLPNRAVVGSYDAGITFGSNYTGVTAIIGYLSAGGSGLTLTSTGQAQDVVPAAGGTMARQPQITASPFYPLFHAITVASSGNLTEEFQGLILSTVLAAGLAILAGSVSKGRSFFIVVFGALVGAGIGYAMKFYLDEWVLYVLGLLTVASLLLDARKSW